MEALDGCPTYELGSNLLAGVLALMNVVQVVALAFLAGRQMQRSPARRRAPLRTREDDRRRG